MAFDYSSLQSVALTQIKDKGVAITVQSSGTVDLSTGEYTSSATTETGYALRTNLTKQLVDQFGMVEAGDIAILADSQATIDPSKRVVLDSVSYQVARAIPIQPGDTLMGYKVLLRK